MNGAHDHHRATNASESKDAPWPPYQLGDSGYVAWFRDFDWASTALGPTAQWPYTLKKACELMLVDPDPITIFWGPDLLLIYNEAYIALAGKKHPALMGGSARVHWAEVWDTYDPVFDQIRVDGKAFKQTNAQLVLHRNGFWEEGFFNILVLPLFDDDGSVVGFYEPCADVTKQTLAERRMHTLLELSQQASSAGCLTELWKVSLDVLSNHTSIAFLALYSLQSESAQDAGLLYDLEGTVGSVGGEEVFPSSLNLSDLREGSTLHSFQVAHQSRTSVIMSANAGPTPALLFQELKAAGAKVVPHTCATYPLRSSGDDTVAALLVIGIDPRRPYDGDYQAFMDLFIRQIEGVITSLTLFEKEKERLTQQVIYESERKFKRFAENAQVGIFSFDPAGNILFCNESWLELSGHDRNDMSAMSWTKDVHPENVDDIKGYWDKIANLEGPQTFEVQYRKPWKRDNGSDSISLDRTWVVASAYAETDEAGQLSGIIGCVTDISGLKWVDGIQSQRLEEALEHKRQQENFLDITSHEMRNPLNAILHCATELTELLPELKKGGPVVGHAEALTECLQAAQTILYCGRHQKRIIDDVLTLSKLDSNLLSITPVATRPLDIVEEVLKIFDTEMRASSIETKVALSESYNALQVDTLLVDSHRLIQILINLVANAIKFTKGESLRNLRIEVNAYLTEPQSSASGVRYVQSGRHRADPTVQPDWGHGESVFLHFSVRDTGPGMTREEANLLFNRFAQASPRTHVQYGGTGLGLFISRELAELHGGRIGISSERGLGSTFDFYVKGRRPTEPVPSPLRNNNAVPKHDAELLVPPVSISPVSISPVSISPELATSAHAGPAASLHVLIVEDNLVNQKILAKLLRKHGYQVSVANHGEEALGLIHTSTWRCRPPDPLSAEDIEAKKQSLKLDIVLADIEMPVMDGKEFVRHIRRQQGEGALAGRIPIIAVTGNARNEQIQQARECGFDEVVRKPYRVGDILSMIGRHTNVTHLQQHSTW